MPLIQAELAESLTGFHVPELKAAILQLLGLGKLFRPLLALAVYQAFTGQEARHCIPSVAPLEMIHTFTLIHDDLPCMDDAQLRRGVATVHIAHGEAMAVLAGDALLNLALLRLALAAGIDSSQRLQLITAATRATHDVVEGQVLDMQGEGREWSLGMLERLHRLKTGALLGACCEFGAVLAGADTARIAEMHSLGLEIGLAFQMRDDLLSYASTESVMGKTLSTDETRQKATYARLLGISQAESMLSELTAGNQARIAGLQLKAPGILLAIAAAADKRAQ